MMTNCRNCQTPLAGEYCANCGQRNLDLERPIWSLVGDVLKETFEVDGRAWLTLRTLFRYPGKLTSDFLDGRRRTYTSPLRLYLVTSIAFFIWVAWLARIGLLLDPGQDPVFDAAVQSRFLSDDLPQLMFVLLPVFAVLMKLMYFRRLYFDHLIFSMHLHTTGYLMLALAMPLEDLADTYVIPMVLQFLLFACFLVYFAIALRRVYASNWWVAAAKTGAILFAYMIVVSIVVETSSSFLIISD